MQYDEDSPFYKLLATKYKSEEEDLGIAIRPISSGNRKIGVARSR